MALGRNKVPHSCLYIFLNFVLELFIFRHILYAGEFPYFGPKFISLSLLGVLCPVGFCLLHTRSQSLGGLWCHGLHDFCFHAVTPLAQSLPLGSLLWVVEGPRGWERGLFPPESWHICPSITQRQCRSHN